MKENIKKQKIKEENETFTRLSDLEKKLNRKEDIHKRNYKVRVLNA
jgi:hypothetical protein